MAELGLPGGEGLAGARIRGAAIQCRVSLAPGGGPKVTAYREPSGKGVRVDATLYEGCSPSMHYDPMVAKLICSAAGEGDAAFQAARQLSLQALGQYEIAGVNTNKHVLRNILQHPEFVKNEVLLSFMVRNGSQLNAKDGAAAAAAAAGGLARAATDVGAPVSTRREALAVSAPLEATVIQVLAKEGAEVKRGDVLVLLSAMKLETEIHAPADGTVTKVAVADGETVKSGQDLVTLDALVAEAGAGALAAHEAAQADRRHAVAARQQGGVDPLAVWYGPQEGVHPCSGPSASSLQLPPVRRDAAFQARESHHRELAEELKRRVAVAQAGGDDVSVKQHRKRGKALPRERIQAIIDPGTSFLELSPLAAFGLYDGSAHSASIVTGIGVVHGREVLFVANDATVKGGTYYPMTVKKHLRAQQIARENRLPCVYLVDSGGAFLPMQDEVFPDQNHFGRIFFNQANMSAQGIPQISAVCGSCTAGGAYVPRCPTRTSSSRTTARSS
eukprot:SRR837773.21736.p1 GENE.SRR837773.21736~~SRR837773.21736.p1  ORF type:complete len:524 (+),score=155.59 SRR837773.21736:69-1574(+)